MKTFAKGSPFGWRNPCCAAVSQGSLTGIRLLVYLGLEDESFGRGIVYLTAPMQANLAFVLSSTYYGIDWLFHATHPAARASG